MMAKIKVVITGHYEDKGQDTMVMVFGKNESEKEIVTALAEQYYLDEDQHGNKIGFSTKDVDWDWLSDEIGSYAWWTVDEFLIEVSPNAI